MASYSGGEFYRRKDLLTHPALQQPPSTIWENEEPISLNCFSFSYLSYQYFCFICGGFFDFLVLPLP